MQDIIGTFSETTTYRVTASGQTTTQVGSSAGKYVLSGTALLLEYTTGNQAIVTAKDSGAGTFVFTLELGAPSYAYAKQ